MNALRRVLLLGIVLLAGCSAAVDPVAGVAQARTLLEQGKAGEARILLKNLVSKHPDVAPARVLLAGIALDEGDAQAANDELSSLGDSALRDVETLKMRVRVDLELGKADVAMQRLQASGELIPQPDRALLVAAAHRARGSPADALAVLREVQEAGKSSEPLALGIAETLAAMGNFELAGSELNRYLATQPAQRADVLRMRGDVLLRQGRPDEAVRDFRAAIDAAPSNWSNVNRVSTELMVADALIAGGHIDAAKVQLAKVEKSTPGTLGAKVLQGQIALLEGRPEEAVRYLDEVTQAGAENPRIQYLLIEALLKSGNVARASELLEQLVANGPESSPSRRLLATLFMQQGRPDRVIDLLGADADLGAADGGNADDDLLAAARLARERATQAISSLTAKLAAAPTDVRARADLAAAQLANGEPAAALETLGAFVEGRQDAQSIGIRLSALYANGNDIEANRVVDRLLNPDAGADLPVLLAAADAAAQRQQNAAVSRLLDRAAALAPADPKVQMRRASVAFADRKYDEAKSILGNLLRADPGNVGAQLALARVSEARGDVAGSRAALEAAVKAQPAAIEPALMLASLELRAGRVEAASKVVDQLVADNKDAVAPNAAGLVLIAAGRFEAARPRFRMAVDREPTNAEYWFNLGEAQLALKDVAAAKESFMRSAELQPDSLRAGSAAVRVALDQKDLAAAGRVAQELVAKLPASPVSWLLLGDTRVASKEFEGAATAFARSFAARATAVAARREYLARLAGSMPRPEEPLLRWLVREPTDTATRMMLADYFLQQTREDQAREHLEIIVKQSPNAVAALNNLAWVLRTADPARAESLARRARAIAPGNAAVMDTFGLILLINGKTQEALASLEQAAAALPDDPSVQYHYAWSLSKAGQKDKARSILGKALKDPRKFSDRQAAQRLYEELG